MKHKNRVRAACLVLGALALIAMGLFRVHRRHQVIQVGYELNERRAELRALEEEGNRLRLEESVLTNPGRIEQLASSLGMIRPKPDQLRVVESNKSVASRSELSQ